jgi:hypothetical protein
MTGQKDTASLEHAYRDFTEIILSLSDEQFLVPMDDWWRHDVSPPVHCWPYLSRIRWNISSSEVKC